ncbi:MAG: polysaccharide ABC transporter ATP-binding protein [Candidatus Acidiferrales bacterium]
MSQIAIHVEGISKRYRLGERLQYAGLRHRLEDALRAPARWLRPRKGANPKKRPQEIWAVRDVSFDVNSGEVVGLIGRNGAGKSTLLKILSRVTQPTTGFAEIHGRVGSLLEVGTGFHPELTGRENVYLNGAVLGMGRKEIARKFDEIVAFSEVEDFIDTPLKHYSTGMQMRLAFAVAAHIEPEILLVDEVLAVGDAQFQKKCITKMSEVSREGRTILFVSHNAAAVARLCSRCILLQSGAVLKDGPVHEVMNAYLRSGLAVSAVREWNPADAPGDEVVRLRCVRVRSNQGRVSETFDIRAPVGIDVVFDVLESGQLLAPNLHLYNEEGVNIFVSIDQDPIWRGRPRPAGRYTSTVWIPGNFLAEGHLTVRAAITTLTTMKVRVDELDAVAFQMIDSIAGDSARGDYMGSLPGVVRPLLEWETTYEPDPNGGSLLGTISGRVANP